MDTDILEKVKFLPLDKQKEIEDIINSVVYPNDSLLVSPEVEQRRRYLASIYKPTYWMADDFNETPEDFKDYI